MEVALYGAAAVAVVATVLAVTNLNVVHAVLYLIVSLLALAMVFFSVGAPFAGILEVIVYAGAIMVLFVFVVMLLNLGTASVEQERRWLTPKAWIGPAVLSGALLWELLPALSQGSGRAALGPVIGADRVGLALYGPYLLAVELASMLLLAGLISAFHLGRHE